MCYVGGGGDVGLARWEMNKPVCVRSGVRGRNAAGSRALRVELVCGALGTSAQYIHNTQITVLSFKTPSFYTSFRLYTHRHGKTRNHTKLRDVVKRDYCFFKCFFVWIKQRTKLYKETRHAVVMALQNRASPTLMSQKHLESIKLVFPRGIGHMLTGAITFALMREEHDCKFSFETLL